MHHCKQKTEYGIEVLFCFLSFMKINLLRTKYDTGKKILLHQGGEDIHFGKTRRILK